MPPKLPTVTITLIRRDGNTACPADHRIGQQWVCDGPLTPGGMCANAYNGLYPTIWMLQNGAHIRSGEDGKCCIQLSCPDTRVRNVFEITRISPPSP